MFQSGDSTFGLPSSATMKMVDHLQPLRGWSWRETREDTREKGGKTNIKWKWDGRDFFPRQSRQNFFSDLITKQLH